jgi:hypothetical protein
MLAAMTRLNCAPKSGLSAASSTDAWQRVTRVWAVSSRAAKVGSATLMLAASVCHEAGRELA